MTPFPMTIPSPGTLRTRTMPAFDLVHIHKDVPLIVEVDTIEVDGESFRRSGLVKKINMKYKRDADPQRIVEVTFADPDIAARTYVESDEITVHLMDYSYLEQSGLNLL